MVSPDFAEKLVWCPRISVRISGLFEDEPAKIELLREYRNNILLKSAQGMYYIALFYRHSPEITAIMVNNHAFAAQTKEVLNMILPQIKSALDGTVIIITPRMMKEIELLLDSISIDASPELREALHTLGQGLHQEEIVHELRIKTGGEHE